MAPFATHVQADLWRSLCQELGLDPEVVSVATALDVARSDARRELAEQAQPAGVCCPLCGKVVADADCWHVDTCLACALAAAQRPPADADAGAHSKKAIPQPAAPSPTPTQSEAGRPGGRRDPSTGL